MTATADRENRFREFARLDINDLFQRFRTNAEGCRQGGRLKTPVVGGRDTGEKSAWSGAAFKRAFINPFTVILFLAATVSLIADVVFPSNFARTGTTFITLSLMILVSGAVRLFFELRAAGEARHLRACLRSTSEVCREGVRKRIPSTALREGDIICLSAGDAVPADVRLISSSHFYVSQGAVSGESFSVFKSASALPGAGIADCGNLVLAGSAVVGGEARGIVVAAGKNTYCSEALRTEALPLKPFERGAREMAGILLRFMCVLVPAVMILMSLATGNWLASLLFALSVAAGLTPELLPLVCTVALARGSWLISKRRAIVKDINAIQALGSMDVLCLDKTGTLTNIAPRLEYMTDVFGNDSARVLDCAYLNSVFQSGVENPVDLAVCEVERMPRRESYFKALRTTRRKLADIPFDYERKFVSVLVEEPSGETELLVKGNVEAVFARCRFVETPEGPVPIDVDGEASVHAVVDEMLADGMKVIAVAVKKMAGKRALDAGDERDLTLVGYLAFFDAPKPTAAASVLSLKKHRVTPKILTGDSRLTAVSVARRVGIPYDRVVTGSDIERMSPAELQRTAEASSLFVELSPRQKALIVRALKANGHVVGFLGDGLNDTGALAEADAGISVDTAVDGAKASADILLLEKDLTILEDGIREGRRTFVNMQKYIRITASSNFGNILTIVCAGVFLPFYPMAALQILLLTLLYDLICLGLPWDRVDEEETQAPRDWSGKGLVRFMLTFGPLSSLFDLLTFAFLYFYLCPKMTGGLLFHELPEGEVRSWSMAIFQTGWFLESLWTQVLILLFLRTRKLPFVGSRPSGTVLAITVAGSFLFTGFTMSPLAALVGFVPLPPAYFFFLLLTVTAYMGATTWAKALYLKRFSSLI